MPLRKVSRYLESFVEVIYRVASELNLREIQYETEFGSEDVDCFASGLYRVNIKGMKDGQVIEQMVIIKWHPDPKTRMHFRESYRREFVFYHHIVPRMLEIQRQFEIIEGLKIKFPNCIYASAEYNKETIVVLDLHQAGFHLRDRFQRTDFAHAALVVKNMAKLHALSFALERANPRGFSEIKDLCSKDVQFFDPDCVSKSMQSYYNASVSVVSDPVARNKLESLAPHILQVLNKCTMSGPHSAICHADCWNNNVLFKYQGTRPVEVLFVDYQLSRYASPVTDLSYFLYMSTEKQLLSEHHNQLVDIYYGTLTAVLRQCYLEAEVVFPKNVFQRHLRRYSVLGLVEALVSLKIVTAAAEEAFQMTEKRYSCEDVFPEVESQNYNLYVERVNGVVDDFFGRGYLLTDVLNYS